MSTHRILKSPPHIMHLPHYKTAMAFHMRGCFVHANLSLLLFAFPYLTGNQFIFTILLHIAFYIGLLVGCIEDLRRFSGISAISRLGSSLLYTK